MGKTDAYKKAVEEWGAESQIGMLVEEMGELLSALNRRSRERTDKSTVEEELADVEIMLAQMRFVFDSEKVDEWKEIKTRRLAVNLGIEEVGKESTLKCYGFDGEVYPDCPVMEFDEMCENYDDRGDGICKHWKEVM